MSQYPLLSKAEQLSLPKLSGAPITISAKFEDSTHQLWHCETVLGPMVLKVCDHASVKNSMFWQGLNQLFGVRFPNHLSQSAYIADYLRQFGALTIPEVIAAKDSRYVLTRFLAGVDVACDRLTDEDIKQLATHLGQLHQQRFDTWGALHAPSLSPVEWGARLQRTIQSLANQSPLDIPKTLLNEVLAEARKINETEFVPIMPDLRWDQLRRLENSHTLAVVDLDAFVIGPRTLELVLIHYLLTAKQLALFKKSYCLVNEWPDCAEQKRPYQLLLLLMNVLGEADLTRWMQQC